MYQQSEVMRLREQITAECLAMNQALYGFASGAGVHNFIVARLNRVGACCNQLEEYVGEQEATRYYVKRTIKRCNKLHWKTLDVGASACHLPPNTLYSIRHQSSII